MYTYTYIMSSRERFIPPPFLYLLLLLLVLSLLELVMLMLVWCTLPPFVLF